ncbi:MAG: phosphate ABC transporter permease PstA [Dysgonamonadaceae bacterium]|nr:phosphate ABC transporter permease PstA [Dysgonamonadaceae bacterium]
MSFQKFRILTDKIFFVFISVLSAIALIPFLLLIYDLLRKGFKQINADFITMLPPTPTDAILASAGGEMLPGGIVNGICGSFFLVLIATLLSVPLGILAGIFIHEKRKSKLSRIIQNATAILYGTPSIIVGICVYVMIVQPTRTFSAIAGGIALSITILPRIIRMTDETLKILPEHLKESGLALGGSYSDVVLKIMIPAAKDGLLTGVLLSLSRSIGGTSPLILTAFGSSLINWDITMPTSSISLLIWKFINIPNMADMLWSASLFLLTLVFSLNIIANRIGWRYKYIMFYE